MSGILAEFPADRMDLTEVFGSGCSYSEWYLIIFCFFKSDIGAKVTQGICL